MAFETPLITLTGSIEAEVHDDTGVAPTTIIKAGSPWSVHVDWEMNGPGANLVAGTWHVHVNLESIGPGPEISLFEFADPDCMNQAFPNLLLQYNCHFDVPGSVIDSSVVPHQGLAMKLVVLLTAVDTLGNRAPIAAYYEGPILQFYNTP
jgi:hypothetical protein